MMRERHSSLLHLTRLLEQLGRVEFSKRAFTVTVAPKETEGGKARGRKKGKGKETIVDEEDDDDGGVWEAEAGKSIVLPASWMDAVVGMVRHKIRIALRTPSDTVHEPANEWEDFLLAMGKQACVPRLSAADSKSYSSLVARWVLWAISETKEIYQYRRLILQYRSTAMLRDMVADTLNRHSKYKFYDGFTTEGAVKEDEPMEHVIAVHPSSLAGKFDALIRGIGGDYEKATDTIWKLMKQEGAWKGKSKPTLGLDELLHLLQVSFISCLCSQV